MPAESPGPQGEKGVTVADLCNHFLTHKTALLESGELAQRTFDRYHAACARLVKVVGRDRVIEDLRPDDFQHLRSVLAKSYGPVALANEIQMTRSVFRYGVEAELTEKATRFGPGFKKPSAKTHYCSKCKRHFNADMSDLAPGIALVSDVRIRFQAETVR